MIYIDIDREGGGDWEGGGGSQETTEILSNFDGLHYLHKTINT